MGNTLREMQAEVRAVNIEKGWRGGDVEGPTFGDLIALLHSEASEALEAYRSWGMEDVTEQECKVPIGEEHRCKPEGVGSELADVLIRLLDMADRCDLDLLIEYERKLAFNRTRAHRHGGKRL